MTNHLDKFIAAAIVISLVALGLGYRRRGTLAPPESLISEMQRIPQQGPTTRAPFTVTYEGVTYELQPVGTYAIWGLVVTHNDITAIDDIDHDATSFDTKDLCLVWGGNALLGHYLFAEFWSRAWTCNWTFPSDHPIDAHSISNNHLVTDDPAVRKRIAEVRVGDQVFIRGILVNYRHPNWPAMRRSSISRDDVGGTACEVVFVEELEIVAPASRLWYRLVPVGWIGLSVSLLAAFVRWLRRGTALPQSDVSPDDSAPI